MISITRYTAFEGLMVPPFGCAEMSLFSRFFYRRPPDGLLEFAERVFGEDLYLASFIYLFYFMISNNCTLGYLVQFLIPASPRKFCQMTCTGYMCMIL